MEPDFVADERILREYNDDDLDIEDREEPQPDLMHQYEAQLHNLREDIIAEKSKIVYINSSIKFLTWLFVNKRDVLTEAFLDHVRLNMLPNQIEPKRASVKQYIDQNMGLPLHFNRITADIFMAWISSYLKPDGGYYKFATYNTLRSSLNFLFIRYTSDAPPVTIVTKLKGYFKALKRRCANNLQAGIDSLKVGKDPLRFDLYKFFGNILIKDVKKDMMIARTFLIVCWNLICRSSSAVQICLDHLGWQDDAMIIMFATHKGDNLAEKPRDPRHVYQNPLHPEICPVLGMGISNSILISGIYFLCTRFSPNEKRLFPGEHQYQRFRSMLMRMGDHPDVVPELNRRGMQIEDLGTHSMRKGAATFCSSGSTNCPSSTSIHIRAGWTLGGVDDTYMRYESAGDQYVGRTVSGLPINCPEFAIVGPYFNSTIQPDDIVQLLNTYFPNYSENLRRLLEHCLASIVYHQDYLLNNLPHNHFLFHTSLFRNLDTLRRLRDHITCEIGLGPNVERAATGIPAHVMLMHEYRTLHATVMNLQRTVDVSLQQIPVQTANAVEQIIERNAIQAGNITYLGFQTMLNDTVTKGLAELASTFRQGETRTELSQTTLEITEPPTQGQHKIYWFADKNGQMKMHRLPKEFEVPDVQPDTAWEYWICPSDSRGYPPLRFCSNKDIHMINSKKRFSEYRKLMEMLEQAVRDRGLWKDNPDIRETVLMYQAVKDVIELPTITPKGRKRRNAQLQWKTVYKKLVELGRL
jgi:hypothetical protein